MIEQFLRHGTIINSKVADYLESALKLREAGALAASRHMRSPAGGHHHGGAGGSRPASTPLIETQPILNAIEDEYSRRFSRRLLLWKVERDELAAFGGELDSALQMPGWTNVWTMPIQNRVDMADGREHTDRYPCAGPEPRRDRSSAARKKSPGS